MMSTRSFLCVILMHLLKVSFMEEVENEATVEKKTDTRRPLWNIANMIDSNLEVTEFINNGANAVGVSVHFDDEGIATDASFGVMCNVSGNPGCGRETDFVKYLEFMRNLTSRDSDDYRDELVLLYMDFYVESLEPNMTLIAGEDVATKLVDHYWQRGESGARAFILITIKYLENIDFIESMRSTLNKTGNFTFYEKRIDSLPSTENHFQQKIIVPLAKLIQKITSDAATEFFSSFFSCRSELEKECLKFFDRKFTAEFKSAFKYQFQDRGFIGSLTVPTVYSCTFRGYDIHGNQNLDEIEKAYEKLDINKNIWQGDGVPVWKIRDYVRLEECIKRREENASYISKVYWWTVDTGEFMKEALIKGIDGLITNEPKVLKDLLNQYEFRRAFKLATHQDSTWEKFTFEIPEN